MAKKKTQQPRGGAEARRAASLGRLENGLRQGGDWYHWGPYLSERQWGTVREDYSADGEAWEYLPHDQARSRAYRWGEDGLAGFSDVEQLLCLGLSLWNGRDSILKERIFGLTGNQGNHGEDAKEYWWYLDATPTHSWNRWRYHYPQAAFPYEALVEENASRGRHDPEFELLDTGIFADDRYWIVEADYAKADPHDLLLTIRVTNQGPEPDTLHVLPTAWYRNTWSWDLDGEKHELTAAGGVVQTEHPFLGALELHADAGPDGNAPSLLFCDNETNNERALRYVRAPVPEGRDQRPRRLRCRLRQPGRRTARRPRTGTGSRSHQGRPWSCGCGCGPPARRSRRGRTSTMWSQSAGRRPMSSTRS